MSIPEPDVTILSVAYNNRGLIGGALLSAVRSCQAAGLVCEVIVVDNASADGSSAEVEQRVPEARLIRNSQNVGFGRAVNAGAAAARAPMLLLLNPDATVESTTVGRLVAVMNELPELGAAAPSIRNREGGTAETAGMEPGLRSALGHFLFLNRLLPNDRGGAWRGFQLSRGPDRLRWVDWAGAACLLVRSQAFEAIRGFDPRFFMYGEDIDLGIRLQQAGWRTVLVPGAVAHHLVSSGRVTTEWLDAIHELYMRINGASRWRLVVFDAICALGLAIRWLVAREPTHRARMGAGARRAAWLMVHGVAPSTAPDHREPGSSRQGH